MSEKKTQVFPSRDTPQFTGKPAPSFEEEKRAAVNEVYVNAETESNLPNQQIDATELMRQRTEQQMLIKKQFGKVEYPELAENQTPILRHDRERAEIISKSEAQMRVRDEHLAKNTSQIQNYQKQFNEASVKHAQPVMSTPVKPRLPEPVVFEETENPYIQEISQPNFNTTFDVIPLPSQGKLRRSKNPNVRLSYLTAADENILTSPNLLQSGLFLEILINRKLLETDLRYKDLHIGDRNAIMLWLRATGYGEMYPITILDENNEPFQTEINLNELAVKSLGAEPDEEGLFYFKFPLTKTEAKFKLLTCGDVDRIEAILEKEKEAGVPVNNASTYNLEAAIVEVNGSRDRAMIKEFANSVRVKDAKDFKKYMDEIESGVDMNIVVRTPGGGSVETFLPLNFQFFWPDFRV